MVGLLAATLLPGTTAVAHENNFTESEACGTGGLRGPLTETGGWLPTDQEIFGPYADFFGRNYQQVAASMVRWTVPGSGGRTVRVHVDALPAFEQVSANLAAAAAEGKTYRVDEAFGWAFRAVTGSSHRMSFHSFGTAVDINPSRNPFIDDPDAELITDMPEWYVQAWRDAGFCWGGDWVSKRDAMHFSWMGPSFTPGYPQSAAPAPVLTAGSEFNRSGATEVLPLADADWRYGAFDRSRDGAPDLYAWRWLAPGTVRVEVVGSLGDFHDVGVRETVGVVGASDTHEVLFASYDEDGRADLWIIERATGATTIYGDTVKDAEGTPAPRYTEVIGTPNLGPVTAATVLIADHNRDRTADAFVIGDDGRLRVLDGASGYSAELVSTATSLNPGNDRLALGDYDLDGVPDIYRVADTVQVLLGSESFASGPQIPSIVPAEGAVTLGDFDGDGRQDVYHITAGEQLTVFLGGRRDAGVDLTAWYTAEDFSPWDAGPECIGPLVCDQIGYVDASFEFNLRDNLAWDGGNYHEFFYGAPGDIPLMGDWDCDGVDTPGMFRPATGFAYLSNVNDTQVAELEYYFGVSGDIPLAGDWDGDGCDTLSIYRPSEGQFYVTNTLETAPAEYSYFFGMPGDEPFTGDFDGDGIDELGLHRPSTGFVYFRLEHASGVADTEFFYGAPGDTVIVGDWDGDGDDTLAILRDAEGRWYFRLDNSLGVADHVLRAGPKAAGIIPVTGAFGEFPADRS